MTFSVIGIGTSLPPYRADQADAAQFASELMPVDANAQRLLDAVYRRSGVQHRHSVLLEDNPAGGNGSHAGHGDPDGARRSLYRCQTLFEPATNASGGGPTTGERMVYYERHAGPLAVEAARRAIQESCLSAEEIRHVVTVSCTGFTAPGVDLELIERLGLAPTTTRTHIGFMGCHGAINGLRVASALAAADPSGAVLLCAVELCSLHHQYGWHPERIVANALFADGAAAVVGRRPAQQTADAWRLRGTGSCILEQAHDMMTWRVQDHGFVMTLSPHVPSVIAERLRPWLESWLQRHGRSIDAIESWIIHPGGPRVVRAVGEALDLEPSATAPSLDVLRQFGNMSSPTVLFILDALQQQNAPTPCVMLAFGPGLAIEAALWDHRPDR